MDLSVVGLGAPVVAIGSHFEDIELFLMVLGTLRAGHGTSEGAKSTLTRAGVLIH